MSSEDESGTRGLIGSWFLFEGLRKEMETKIHDLELSNLNLHYSVRTEAEFRDKLKQIRILHDKIEILLGPPKETSTVVS